MKYHEALKAEYAGAEGEGRSSYSLARHWNYQRSQKLNFFIQVEIPIKAKWGFVE